MTLEFDVIILASNQKGPLYDEFGCANRALFPVHGKPLLDWVADAFHGALPAGNVVVIGDPELDQLSSMRFTRKRFTPGSGIYQDIKNAAAYLKSLSSGVSGKGRGILVASADAALLSPEAINGFLERSVKRNADIVIPGVKINRLPKDASPPPFTVVVADKPYAAGQVVYARSAEILARVADTLSGRETEAKDPRAFVAQIGDQSRTDIPDLERELTRLLAAEVRLDLEAEFEIVTGVTDPSGVEMARSRLTSPWNHRYRKARLIYNPQAGQGMQLSPVLKDLLGIRRRRFEVTDSREEDIGRICGYLRGYGIPVELAPTEAAGHATELARDAVERGFDLVVAAGGDGTINEVINGLAGTDVVLGVVPLGTANVFGIEMKLPVEFRAACQVIASGNTRRIDLGRANGRYFVCMAGIGFDAHVLRQADSKLKKIYGALAYLLVGLRDLFTYRFRQIIVKIDDQPIPRKGYFIVIGNGKYYGGDMMFASKADLSDGFLDVCIFRHMNWFSVFNYLFGFHRGDIDRHLDVEYFQCRRIRVYKKGKHPVHVDAEYLCESPVEIEVCPGSLYVAV